MQRWPVVTNADVRAFWEAEACGTGAGFLGDRDDRLSAEWFAEIESVRYEVEPFVHQVAQFTRYAGRRVLEIGVGAGTDHLQFARAGAVLSGVDLTDTAIETTRAHLAVHGYTSDLCRADAEELPYDDGMFDLVYSYGVIHHAEHPERVVAEIRRVLRPEGEFRGMLYHRRSVVAYRRWVQHCVKDRRLWPSVSSVLARYMESPGTRAYTLTEARALFGEFATCTVTPIVTPWDGRYLPRWVLGWIPGRYGWYLAVHAAA